MEEIVVERQEIWTSQTGEQAPGRDRTCAHVRRLAAAGAARWAVARLAEAHRLHTAVQL